MTDKKLHFHIVAGARPNFMKISPLIDIVEQKHSKNIDYTIVHTGQHYDKEMSENFFRALDIPEPDINLEVGSASHAVQTAEIMKRYEKVLRQESPDLVVVVGDVNSTIACSLVAVKMNIAVAHIEAGLRSYDRKMPEEINRILTDRIADYLFTTSEIAVENLLKEGCSKDSIYFVGNVMIDTLKKHLENTIKPDCVEDTDRFCLLTLHRPSNVDSKENLAHITSILEDIQKRIAIVFPIHPRSEQKLKDFKLMDRYRNMGNLKIVPPLEYRKFLYLMSNAVFVLTDSGGIQEETTVLDTPCLTLRENTERPETIREGTNILVGTDREKIFSSINEILSGRKKERTVPEKWDGKASDRILEILKENLEKDGE